jgi:hypothetical protein
MNVTIIHKKSLGKRFQDMTLQDIPPHALCSSILHTAENVILADDADFRILKSRVGLQGETPTRPLSFLGELLSICVRQERITRCYS